MVHEIGWDGRASAVEVGHRVARRLSMREGAVRLPVEDPPTVNTPDADDPPLQTTGREAGGIVTRMTTAIPDETVGGITTDLGLSERSVVCWFPSKVTSFLLNE